MGTRRTTSGARTRGQPVVVLLALLACWIAVRVITFRPPVFTATGQDVSRAPARLAVPARPLAETSVPSARAAVPIATRPSLPAWHPPAASAPPELLPPVEQREPSIGLPSAPLAPVSPAPAEQAAPEPARMAVGQTLLLAAGLSGLPVPPVLQAYVARMRQVHQPATRLAAAPFPVPAAGRTKVSSRWSADGWLLWREESSSPLLSGLPAYGRSQAGAVVRFDLARASSHRPQAYLRGSVALAGAREKEVALGLSARPLGKLPLRVAAELRAGETVSGTKLRPSAYAVTEIPPIALPGDARGEVYAQVGYVGGAYATAFVDGQARIDRPVVSLGDAELRAGAGTWGGAQKHAARLDVGPTASIGFDLGQARGRLAADYRFRLAGNARPASGPALTLSAGF